MFSLNNNSEIDIDSTYTKYGQCRCCSARGQHRDVDKEYYFNNIKEVYRDIFLKCYNLSLSPHNLISPLICENCVLRLRDASSFRMMVAASEELLLNTVIFKSDPENDPEFVHVPQNFTTEVKIENNLDIINMIPSPDVFQDELESSTENEQVNDEGWVNDNERLNDDFPLKDKERMNDDVPLKDKERTNDDFPLKDTERTNDDFPLKDKERTNNDAPLNGKERTNDDVLLKDKERTNDVRVSDEERMNDDDEWSDGFDDPMNDDDGLGDSFDDPMNDDDGWSDVFDDLMNDDIRINDNERTNDDVPLNDKERVNDNGWSDVFVDPMNDDDDWSTDTDNELVIDEDRGRISSGTDDILTDEDLDECGSIFNSTITRSETSSVDDEPSAMVKGEKKLLSKFTPVRPLPKRRQLVKICPKFNEHLKKLQYKTVKPKSIEWFFKTKTPKIKEPEQKNKRERETKTKLSDKQQALEPSIPEKLVKPITILSHKQALAAYSIPDKLIEPKSIGRVSKTIPPKTKGTKTKSSDKQALETSIREKLVEPKTILSHKQALPASFLDKLTGPKSIERVSKTKRHKTKEPKTKLSVKKALEASIPKKLVELKTISSHKQAVAAYIPDKLIEPKTIVRVSKTKTPKTKQTTKLSDKQVLEPCIPEKLVESKTLLSDKRALAASIPEKLVESKTILSDKPALAVSIPEKLVESKSKLSDKQALPAILIISIPDKLVESKTLLSDKRALAVSIPEKLVIPKTILSDKQALAVSIPEKLVIPKTIFSDNQALPASIPDKLVEHTSIERVSKTETPKTEEQRTKSSEKQALAVDATTLFEFSNATAFQKKNRNGYPCFYCREVYKYNRLKEHQENKHSKGSIYTLLAKYYADDFVINAEITDLKCTICKKDINDLYELREHLSKKHGKKMHKTPDRIIPFKLQETDFECQICGRMFDTFALVEKHMNTHFGTFVCKTCGTAFITKHRLAVHTYSSHKNDKIKCKVCKKPFATYMKMRVHYEGVHEKNKTVRCTKCPEKFIDHYSRMKHLADSHGAARHLYQCDECEKGFTRRSSLHDHVNRRHMPENNEKMKCDECSFNCYTKSELKDHKLTHGGAQAFECDICKKVYNRRRSLAMHLKTHMTRVKE